MNKKLIRIPVLNKKLVRLPRFKSVADMYRDGAHLFENQYTNGSLGTPSNSQVRDVMVVDNFYEDPDSVRDYALGLQYAKYSRQWYSSALEIRDNELKGKGIRLAHDAIKSRLAEITQSTIDDSTWATSGDGWNGAFHYKKMRLFRNRSTIHNHCGRLEDVNIGWSGLVYLSPNPKNDSGTSIWLQRKTGKAYSRESIYDNRTDDYDLVIRIKNQYNRLVLFNASVLHMGDKGYGLSMKKARLFQTFFFNVK